MTTVVDELIIKLALDPSNFTKGQQQTVQSLRKMEEEARSAGKGTEEAAKKMADGFERVTKEVLSLGAAFLGVNGLKDLAVSTTTSAANLGVLSQALNTNAEALNRWQNAGRHAGIGVEQTAAAIASFQTKLQQFRSGQIGPEGIGGRELYALAGITTNDLFTQDWETLLKRISRGVRAHPESAAGLLGATPLAGIQGTLQRPDLDALLATSQTIMADQIKAASEIRDIFVSIVVRLERRISQWLPEGASRARGVLKGINQIEQGNLLEGIGNIDRSLGSTPNAPSMFDWRPRSLPVKEGAGNFNPATAALADFLKEAFKDSGMRITAADDAYHAGRGGHGRGLALDFTIAGGEREYAIAAARLGRIPGLKAINEFAPGSSAGWTAPHLHVQFRDPAAAADFVRGSQGGGSSTTVGQINVYTQPGADPHAIGAAVRDAINSPETESGAH